MTNQSRARSANRHRRSIRLRDYDYTQPGAYFVTICTHDRACFLATVTNGTSVLSEAGHIVRQVWLRLPQRLPHVEVDAFVVMPNHVHGILLLRSRPTASLISRSLRGAAAGSLGAVVGAFKASTAARINALRSTRGAPVWQRNYYERVIRASEREGVRRYIDGNPLRWDGDEHNPAHVSRHDPAQPVR